MLLYEILLGGLLIAGCAGNMPGGPDSGEPLSDAVTFHKPESDTPIRPAEFNFTLSGKKFKIHREGLCELSDGDRITQVVSIPLPGNFLIESFSYGVYERDIVLYYQLYDGHDLSAGVARLNYNAGKTVWTAAIPGFNIGEPLVHGSKLYVTAFGFIGKMDLNSGVYDWQHDELYDDGAFNAFKRPKLSGDVVVFEEIRDIPRYSGVLRIHVDDASGRMLGIREAAK